MADKIIVKPLVEIPRTSDDATIRAIELNLRNLHDTLKQIATELDRISRKVE